MCATGATVRPVHVAAFRSGSGYRATNDAGVNGKYGGPVIVKA